MENHDNGKGGNLDRREFLAASAVSAVVLATTGNVEGSPVSDLFALEAPDHLATRDSDRFAAVPTELQERFDELVEWLDESGWREFLRTVFGVDLVPGSAAIAESLFKKSSRPKWPGFEDFATHQDLVRMIEPGKPEESLLYHALASPKVAKVDSAGRQTAEKTYPTLNQLDLLEDYIYACKAWSDDELRGVVAAVFAYEYRPAEKTPHGAHADMVFSRTGIARIGNHAPVYVRRHRCFVNSPESEEQSEAVAVTPARYAVFLARPVVNEQKLSLIKVERGRDRQRTFLLPMRKVFRGDPLLGGAELTFAESHLNEKLARLVAPRPRAIPGGTVTLPAGVFDTTKPPFVRRSSTSTTPAAETYPGYHDTEHVSLTQIGSSVLVTPVPGDLVRKATQETKTGEQRVRIRVPPFWEAAYSADITNRRYTTLKVEHYPHRNGIDFLWSDGLAGGGAQTTGIRSPRNAPVFLNIRYEVDEMGAPLGHLSGRGQDAIRIKAGGYWAALFEDGICDGCVQAVIAAPA